MRRVEPIDDEWGQQQQGKDSARPRCENTPPPPHSGGGPRPKRFITYEAFAKFFGAEVDTVRHWVARKLFDPSDLQSVVGFKEKRQRRG